MIVSYIKNNNTKLRLFKYNKNLREKLNINNFSYEKYILFNSIYEKIKLNKKIKCYYNYKGKSIINLIKYNDEKIKNKIIEDFFLDIYQIYSKEIAVFIDVKKIILETFKNFILIKSPFKVVLKIHLNSFDEDIEKLKEIIENKNIIKGFKFCCKDWDDLCELYGYDESFINKFPKFNNLEYISIPIELINKIDFSKNKFKFIKLIFFYYDEYNDFLTKWIKKYLTKNLEGLILKFIKEDISFESEKKIKKLKLHNFSNLRILKLKGLPNECLINTNTLQTINNLDITSTNIIYQNSPIYFKNLKSLCINGISFNRMFENTEDFSFLLNLEILKIEYK